MTAALILEPELLAATNYTRRGDLERWLLKEHIPYFRGRDGALFTTLRLLESVHLPQASANQSAAQAVEF